MDDRDFKGVWIPKEVWLDDRLSMLEKGILVEIDSLDLTDRGCFASNQYLADFCQCGVTKVSTAIAKLTDLGYIYTESFDGRQRILKSRLANSAREPYRKCKTDFQKVKAENNKINNTEIKKELDRENLKRFPIKQFEAEFEKLWAAYPNKKGKPNALRDYIKARKNGVEYETVANGIQRYNAWIRVEHKEEYVKNGSTWFHQECWNDDYTPHRPATTRDLHIPIGDFFEEMGM